jgi:hypothetical protein
MTVLDISRTAQQEAVADTELAADDAQRLHLMEAMLSGRGYSRNQHGFWDVPGSRITAAKAGSEAITRETDTEDEDTAKVA